MAGHSQSDRIASLEEQVGRLTEALEDVLDAVRDRPEALPRAANPAPSGYDPTALMVAMLDRMPSPNPAPQTDVLELALKLAKELRPPPEQSNAVAEATNLLAPVIMDVLAQRNRAPAPSHDGTASKEDGRTGT